VWRSGLRLFALHDLSVRQIGWYRRQRALVIEHDAHDALSVGKLEVSLNGLAVAGGGRNIVDSQDVGGALVPEECDRALGDGSTNPSHLITFSDANLLDVGEAQLALDPAVSGDDDIGLLGDDVVGLREGADVDDFTTERGGRGSP
jgi:hypothetical protein